MQDRMFNTADILIDGAPVGIQFFRKRRLVIFRVGIAQIIPGRTQERIHGIRFTYRISAALRAFTMQEAFTGGQR